MKTTKHKLQITLLIFFTARLVSSVSAQKYEYVPMPTKNAVWSEIYYPGYENGDASLERFALNGEDTTINNLVYNKLFFFTTRYLVLAMPLIFDTNNVNTI